MKILIFSDSHGDLKNIDMVIKRYENDHIDYIIHAGDYGVNICELTKRNIICVSGNCDFDRTAIELDIELGGVKFFITHGHKYQVKYDLFNLEFEAEYRNSEVCIYGHTHFYDIHKKNGILYLNPGSISSYTYQSSYIYLEDLTPYLYNVNGTLINY